MKTSTLLLMPPLVRDVHHLATVTSIKKIWMIVRLERTTKIGGTTFSSMLSIKSEISLINQVRTHSMRLIANHAKASTMRTSRFHTLFHWEQLKRCKLKKFLIFWEASWDQLLRQDTWELSRQILRLVTSTTMLLSMKRSSKVKFRVDWLNCLEIIKLHPLVALFMNQRSNHCATLTERMSSSTSK